MEFLGSSAALTQCTPPGDEAVGPALEFLGGQADGLDVGSVFDRGAKFDQGNVVVLAPAVVA